MSGLPNPLILTLTWLAPFFLLVFQAGCLYYQRRGEDQNDLSLKLNIVNIALIAIIAARDITLLAYSRRGNISIGQEPGPFFGIFILLVLAFGAGFLYSYHQKKSFSLNFKRLGFSLLALSLSLIITATLIGGNGSLSPWVATIAAGLERLLPHPSSASVGKPAGARQKENEALQKKLAALIVPQNLYPGNVPGMTANPIQMVGINGITVWYQPDDPNISNRAKGVTVYITKQPDAKKAADFLWPAKKTAFPVEGGNLVLNGQEMYQGFNQADANSGQGLNRAYQTYLTAWTKGPFTFEVYSSMEDNADINKDLLITLAREVADMISRKSQVVSK